MACFFTHKDRESNDRVDPSVSLGEKESLREGPFDSTQGTMTREVF